MDLLASLFSLDCCETKSNSMVAAEMQSDLERERSAAFGTSGLTRAPGASDSERPTRPEPTSIFARAESAEEILSSPIRKLLPCREARQERVKLKRELDEILRKRREVGSFWSQCGSICKLLTFIRMYC
mgnify:CR=1 FL=1|jgi:hypothetical protein